MKFSLVIVLFLAILAYPLYQSGIFKTFSGTLGNKCSLINVPGLIGVEDIDISPIQNVYDTIHPSSPFWRGDESSDDRYWYLNLLYSINPPFSEKNGDIYSLNYLGGKDLSPQKMKLKNYKEIDFHPHGIGFMPQVGDLLPRLFVVNHRRDGDFVELFDVDFPTNTLIHVTSIGHPSFYNINDITPLDHNSFFVTNLLSQPTNVVLNLRIILESLLIRPGGSLVFCRVNEGDCIPVLENLYMSNGVMIKDTSLYLVVDKEIHQYHVHKHNTTLSLKEVYPTSSTCDNLGQGTDGTIYTACHPSIWLAFRHIIDHDHNHAPTQIMKKGKNEKNFSDFLLSAGEDWPAATVAVPDNEGFIYLGSVWAEGVMRCEMK